MLFHKSSFRSLVQLISSIPAVINFDLCQNVKKNILDVIEGNICDNHFGPGKDEKQGAFFGILLMSGIYLLPFVEHLIKQCFIKHFNKCFKIQYLH